MLDAVLIFFQVAASLILVVFILLHAGRGGGLSDMFGGASGMGGSMAGSTVVERNLDRMTVVVALVWILATVALGLRLS